MSRTSRHRNSPELARGESAVEMAEEDRPTVHRLTGELHDAFEAILSGCAITARGPALPAIMDAVSDVLSEFGEAAGDEFEDDFEDAGDADDLELGDAIELDDDLDTDIEPEVDELGAAFGGIALTTRILARGLLARVLDRERPSIGSYYIPGASAGGSEVEPLPLGELTQALLPPNLPAEIRPSKVERKEAFAEAASVIREVGLEEFEVSCYLGSGQAGIAELFIYPRSSESAHVALLEFLFNRAEGFAQSLDPLLAAERDASSWEFSRWSTSSARGRGSGEEVEFSQSVREQEYSLVDRRTIALGDSVMGEILKDPSFAELFPRQRRMAQALVDSVAGVFECVALEGTHATFRSMHDGRTYRVHEHMDPIVYSPGWIGAGRLLPFDGDLYLRSPGMLFSHPDDPERLRAAVDALNDFRGTLPRALALEGFISSEVLNVSVPRAMKPARSRTEAREALAALAQILADAEQDREVVPDEAVGVGDGEAEEDTMADGAIRLDATLEGFMAALAKQAVAAGGRERQRGGRGRKKKPKRRR
jgi:hypothetical protein